MSRFHLLTIILSLFWQSVYCQPFCHAEFYDEDDGLPHSHLTQVLQDKHGFLWISTWNGLCRYDGYEFQTFKPQLGDGCHMGTDRLRDISLLPDGNILCRVDDAHFLFDTRLSRFFDLDKSGLEKASEQMYKYRQSQSLSNGKPISWKDTWGTIWSLSSDGALSYKGSDGSDVPHPLPQAISHPTFACVDSQSNLWVICSSGLCKITTGIERATRLAQENSSEVKCLFTDSQRRIWVCTKEDHAVRLYSQDDGHLIGYLSSEGTLRHSYAQFTTSIYCIHQSPDGTFWLGSKPDGLFRLHETSPNHFSVQHIDGLPSPNVYSISTDRFGRLWVATLGGGLCYSTDVSTPTPSFTRPAHYPSDGSSLGVRLIHITNDGILTAATTDGFLVSRIESDASKMTFHRHVRDPHRANSLSSSATMDIMSDSHGHIYITTESGGINIIESKDLLNPQPIFRHLNASTHDLPSDVTLSITSLPNGSKMIVGSNVVSIISKGDKSTHVLDSHFFNADYRFSDAHPQMISGDRWLFGLTDGAIITTSGHMDRSARTPNLVLTGATIQGTPGHWGAEWSDTIVLDSHQRNITLHFAAIDFDTSRQISYAFRLLTDNSDSLAWNHIGHDRSITFLDLSPGTYFLEIRSTDGDGQWKDNTRRVVLIVEPTFWQSWAGHTLLSIIFLGVISLLAFTTYYIRKIKRQQRETLEAYLSLLRDDNNSNAISGDDSQPQVPTTVANPHVNPEDDAMIKRLMTFIEDNLGNSEIRVADMASAAATSPSSLQRKLRQTMGVTPQDLLREARIKHACQLLRQSDKSISEVAYACGFSDPKYFSRCFKASTSLTPKEYKNSN